MQVLNIMDIAVEYDKNLVKTISIFVQNSKTILEEK